MMYMMLPEYLRSLGYYGYTLGIRAVTNTQNQKKDEPIVTNHADQITIEELGEKCVNAANIYGQSLFNYLSEDKEEGLCR